MGKKKQQKLYQLNNKKDNPAKQQMKDILKQLAEMKHKNKESNSNKDGPIDLSIYKKKIKKEEKLQKYLKKQKQKNDDEKIQNIQPPSVTPKVNIFAVDTYESGIKTVINNQNDDEMVNQEKLGNQTNRLMGGGINFQTFGQKPLKIIENVQKVELSDDENEPNSMKNITHPNIAIPTGNHIFARSKQIIQFRSKLPIFMKEQEIVETINNHLVTLICGETGSGKSTQIGQFLIQKNYHKFGKIGITQTRRLATIALASRVADQVGVKLGEVVGFQVRHQRKDSPSTLIKYLTDGIILNQMSSDYMLNNYSVIVVDQAHERKVNTDILIGLLSKLVVLRYKLSLQGKCHPLRLIIMSATMRVQDFQNESLFNYQVPIINVEARMFSVTVYYQKQTPEDYKEAAVKKCLKIHHKLPSGDVLVFLTGKQQIHEVAIMLEQALNRDQFQQKSDDDQQQIEMEVQQIRPQNYQIYCLYSSLPLAEQQKIFKQTPQNCRKFVISTNIAQTSLTIPNIRYVIDSGQEKHRYHEGVWKWRKGWGSRAMAQQRSGRAGRTTHGYCYRLYSSALYANIMDQYALPEICKLPLDSVILQLKSIGIPDVFSFPFPTAPQKQKIKSTLQSLSQIKAVIGFIGADHQNTAVTQLGNVLSFLPLDPRLGKILLMGRKLGVAEHSLLLVILLTVESIFRQQNYKVYINKKDDENMKGKYFDEMRSKSQNFKNKYKKYIMQGHFGDIFTCINIIGQFFVKLHNQKGNIMNRIRKQSINLQLNQNVMRQVYFNADQIAQIYQTLCQQKMILNQYRQPNKSQINALLTILLDAFIKNLCRAQQKNKYKNKDNQIVLIHHLSDTYLSHNLFVSCTQFFGNQHGKTFMRYSFPVQNYQLLSTYGTVNPPTEYAWRENKLVGLSTGTIYGWQIPNILIRTIQSDIKYIYVAKFLLEGKILQPFKVFQKYLKAPTSIIKPDNLDYKVQKLTYKLRLHKIDHLQPLITEFEKDKKFLKEELKIWVNMKNFDEVYDKIRGSILNSKKLQKV